LVEETREELSALTAQVKELKEAVGASATAVAAAVATPQGPRSYAAAAAGTTRTAEQASVLAREARMRRQILVEKEATAGSDCLGGLSELELKEKANLALIIMEEKIEGAAFAGAKKLASGAVVFACINDGVAAWLKRDEVMAMFVAALGGTCMYRLRRIEMVAEMVPVDMEVNDAGAWRLVEAESGIADSGIQRGRWIKAPERRNSGQHVAHMKVEFTTAEAANHAIDNGLFIRGKYIRVHKGDDEAKRCAKCQKYDGHLANACTATDNVCGRCTGAHLRVHVGGLREALLL
jgi:hypothetical protein